jgi:Flp pilus assembly protein TadB
LLPAIIRHPYEADQKVKNNRRVKKTEERESTTKVQSQRNKSRMKGGIKKWREWIARKENENGKKERRMRSIVASVGFCLFDYCSAYLFQSSIG